MDVMLLVQQVGPVVGVLIFLFTSLAKGWLWTSNAVNKLEAVKNEVITLERAAKDEWRDAYLLTSEASREDRRQLGELLKISETNTKILQALLDAAERRSP